MAIKMAMNYFVSHVTEQDQYIKLFSDLRAAIQALNNSTVSSQLVKNTVE